MVWPDHVIRNGWLEVIVKATATTGLAERDVHYWGNVVGETGNSESNALVDSSDEREVRSNPFTYFDPAPITSRWDFNRDKKVDAQDQLLARLQLQRDAVSGVSLDEELVALVRFQQAFQAASRLIDAVNQMTDTLLALGR